MEEIFPAVDLNKCLITYVKVDKAGLEASNDSKPPVLQLPSLPEIPESKRLTTKNALEFLLDGTLKSKVCRYCLNLASQLSHLDLILEVAGKGSLFKVTIKDIVASFHPFKVVEDPNFPDKICENCLNRAISCYLFTQQCDQAERALKNCFEDIYDKIFKLDPIERTKKRGRHKLHPNHNTIHTEHDKVINYAEPTIHMVNTTSEILTNQTPINDLECLKCCEILPNVESLLNHTKKHPVSMWYNCRLCGMSFAKRHHIKKHFSSKHSGKSAKKEEKFKYDCMKCGVGYLKSSEYLQHLEKHKFKTVMEHLVEKKMQRLCALCFNRGSKMTSLEDTIYFHGISPELTGDRTLYTILSYTLPGMQSDSYTGTKICERCLNNALTSYVFITQSNFARNRMGTCVTSMLDKLNSVPETENNICIEIATNAIMNIENNDSEAEDDMLKVDILEDEFRLESEDDSETEVPKKVIKKPTDIKNKTNKTINGYKFLCNEFLTFKKKSKPKKRFICPVCKKHFISDYFLKRHCLKHLPGKAECNICNIQFKSKFDLYEHKKMSHVQNKSMYLSCEICQRCFTEKLRLDRHRQHHKNPFCQLCDKNFMSQSTYIQHTRRHIKKLAIVMKKHKQFCSFCEKECSNDNEFSLHVNKVHLQIKPYSCDMCERHFYTDYNLKCHRRVHSVYSKEECEFCNKILYSRKKLVIHIRKHIGDMPFYCQLCNQSFYSEFQLNKHLTAHHGGKFCCKFCKAIFVTKKELNNHTNKVHNVF